MFIAICTKVISGQFYQDFMWYIGRSHFYAGKKTIAKEFSDSPGKFHWQGVGSIPGGGAEIPQATWCAQKIKIKKK